MSRRKEGTWAHRHQGYLRFYVGFYGVVTLGVDVFEWWLLGVLASSESSLLTFPQVVCFAVGPVMLPLLAVSILLLAWRMSVGAKKNVLSVSKMSFVVCLAAGVALLALGGDFPKILLGWGMLAGGMLSPAVMANINDLEVR
ncbi:hypothetical protein OZX67_07155 [Bifidobacterium sp. ESL0728]|uniref:hypothetical protein n=1 Tax=Bifidobacterium sp. ESL0728 TaxID=2983220 RepID=UPI0023F6A7F4|nr:hypothetical protein [Bifidobacterium sp. ESL0728]WEV58575.1 hypothetical protein OZX67_07155 [Bifidobacterium sp. ESL0728]